MKTTRREFVRTAALGAGAVGAGLVPGGVERLAAAPASMAARPTSPGRSLRILILGGTGFIGPHLVREVLARGHTPVLFNRGRSEPRLFEEQYAGLESLVGDRDGDISALEGGRWDAVIDDSGYTPQQVRATAELLKDAVDRYVFTSTRAVYAGYTADVMDEDAPLGMAGVPEERWEGYGPMKVLAERVVRETYPGRFAIVRPPIITGPGDSTDRFTYWYVRVDEGGEVLAPGDPSDPVQYVDVRDLVEFQVRLVEEAITGAFNVAGPAGTLTSAGFLHGVRAVTSSPVDFTWVDWDFLEAHGLRPGQELSSWRPPAGDWLNYGRIDNRRAIAAGMTFRPLAVTAGDTLAWWKALPAERREAMRAGFPRAKEREVLAAWRARTSG